MEKEKSALIAAGTVANTHGVRGEIKILPRGIEAEALLGAKTLTVGGTAYAVTASRVHKGCLLAKLKDVNDMDAALALKNKPVTVRRGDIRLPEGEYLDEELVGLTARNAASGEVLGKVDEVLTYPAHKIYAVRGGADEYLVPAVPAFIAGVDLKNGTVDIHVWEGMGSHED